MWLFSESSTAYAIVHALYLLLVLIFLFNQVIDVAVSLAKVADVDRNLGDEATAIAGFKEGIKLLESLTVSSEEVDLEKRVWILLLLNCILRLLLKLNDWAIFAYAASFSAGVLKQSAWEKIASFHSQIAFVCEDMKQILSSLAVI